MKDRVLFKHSDSQSCAYTSNYHISVLTASHIKETSDFPW